MKLATILVRNVLLGTQLKEKGVLNPKRFVEGI